MEEESGEHKVFIEQQNIKQEELPNEQMEDFKEQYIINFVDVDNMETEVKEENHEITANDYKYSDFVEDCSEKYTNVEDIQTTSNYGIPTFRKFEENIPACSKDSATIPDPGNAKHLIGLKSFPENKTKCCIEKTTACVSNTVVSNTCKKQISTEGNIGSHSGSGNLKCEICGKCFHYIGSLRSHLSGIHHISQGNCNSGKSTFYTLPSFQKHQIEVNKCRITYKCESCEKRFSSLRNLNSHTYTYHNDKCYMCDECGRRFSYFWALKCHINEGHDSNSRRKCNMCNKVLLNNDSFKKHMNFHKRIRNFICDICDKEFFTSNALNAHNNSVHKGIRKFKCHDCGKMLSTLQCLRNHFDVKHKYNSDFKCDLCGKLLSTANFLKYHILKVHGKNK